MEENVYSSLSTEAYDIINAEAPADALEFYLRRLETSEEPVLEPMCGSGRFLIPFLERGIDIDGIDASDFMLKKCRQRCEMKGLTPVLYEQFMQKLELPRRYGYIFIPAGSFCLITDEKDARESLKRLYQHLLPRGKLVIEVMTPQAHTKTPGQSSKIWLECDDGAYISISRLPTYNPETQIQRCTSRYELFEKGCAPREEIETIELHLYERNEFYNLLKTFSFIEIKTSKAYVDKEPDAEDSIIIFECRKNKLTTD
jgi:SAM-dependent methyltransferase